MDICKITFPMFLGEIYSASNVNNGLSVAIKAESLFSEKKSLLAEVASLRLAQNIPFTCQYFSCGRNDTINFAIMQLLGISLSVVKKKQPDHKFLPTQTVMLIVQALECLRGLHEKDLIHRDVKPVSFIYLFICLFVCFSSIIHFILIYFIMNDIQI